MLQFSDFATQQVARHLRGIRIVEPSRYAREAKTAGKAQAARTLGVSAVVLGRAARLQRRWTFLVAVRSGDGSRMLQRRAFPLRTRRLDRATASKVAKMILGALRLAGPPAATRTKRPARPRPQPPQAPKDHHPTKDKAAPPKPPAQRTKADGSGGVILEESSGIQQLEPTDEEKQAGLGFAVADADARSRPPERPMTEGQEPTPPLRRQRLRSKPDKTPSTGSKHGQPTERPSWESIVEGSLGLTLINRQFRITTTQDEPPAFSTPAAIPVLHLVAAAYPLAAFTRSFVANLGIVVRFSRALGLKSRVNTASGSQLVETLLQQYEAGLVYRWNLLNEDTSPSLRCRLSVGQQLFDLGSAQAPMPDITYSYLRPSLKLEWPFFVQSPFVVGADVSFDYLAVFSAGDIEQATQDAFGPASVLAFEFGGGMFARYHGFFARLSAFYRRFQFSFDSTCAVQNTCRGARNAVDLYIGGTVDLGYAY